MSVRTNWVEDSFALLNGAPTYVTLVGGLNRAHDVRIELPPKLENHDDRVWPEASTARRITTSRLITTPRSIPPSWREIRPSIVSRSMAFRTFWCRRAKPASGTGSVPPPMRRRSCAAGLQMWGSLPYKKYVFLNLITEAGGGARA